MKMIKDLLFFAKVKQMDKMYKDEHIYRYYFIDLRTDKIIGLPLSKYADELTEIYKRKYYESIEQMCEDYDILFKEDSDGISEVNLYTEVKRAYLDLLKEHLKPEEINRRMLESYERVKVI